MTKTASKSPAPKRQRAAPKAIQAIAAPALTVATPKGKLGDIVQLMRREEGARLDEMMALTGWQAHSVRGAIAGAVKKKLGLAVSSEKSDAGRVYRIVSPQSAA